MKASEAEYRSLVENIPKLIFRLDLDGHCVFVNLAVQSILGWPTQAVMSAPACEISWDTRTTGPTRLWPGY